MFTTEGTRISFSGSPPEEAVPLELTSEEREASKIVFSVLEHGGIDITALYMERAKDYLKIVAPVQYRYRYELCFCRLKLSGRSRYIALTIGNIRSALKSDPRFDGVQFSNKRFIHIPIKDAACISLYEDIILNSFYCGTEIDDRSK